MQARIAYCEDPDQTAQLDLDLHSLSGKSFQ